jgi:hypothetical protein
VAAEIAGEDSTPVCHRCLTPHSAEVYFCPECGAPVGTYTNWLPFPYLFSIGHTLRIGTEGTFKRSPLVIAGFFLFSLAEYTVFAPVYWVQFLKHVRSPPPPNPAGGESTASGHDDDLPNLPG